MFYDFGPSFHEKFGRQWTAEYEMKRKLEREFKRDNESNIKENTRVGSLSSLESCSDR